MQRLIKKSYLGDRENINMLSESGYESQFDEEKLEQVVKLKKLEINKLLREETDAIQRRAYRDAIDKCDDYICGVTCINCLMHDMYHMKLLHLFKDEKQLFPEEWRFYIDATTVDPNESFFLTCMTDKK